MFTESDEFTLLRVNSWLLFTWRHPLCCREALLQCPYHSKLQSRPSTPQVRSRVPMQCYNPAGGRESTSRKEQAPCSWSPWASHQREAGAHHARVQHRCFDSLVSAHAKKVEVTDIFTCWPPPLFQQNSASSTIKSGSKFQRPSCQWNCDQGLGWPWRWLTSC